MVNNWSFASDERIIPFNWYVKGLFTESPRVGSKSQTRVCGSARLKEIFSGKVV